ncbi:MAG TPA: hypothetical protein VFE54_03305, partial [Mucilaginibacter sp.]|nr:hypothetical protein [Mucilaginibacter sp.]
MRCITTAIIAILFCAPAVRAQGLLKGRVYDGKTDSVMSSTTIYNLTKKHFILSAHDGDYSIVADEGDQVVFSATGYLADTVKVLNYMIDAGFDVTMFPRATLLKNVTVKAGYQTDSLKRREDYAEFYDRPKRELVSKTGPSNGVGIAFSPISFFSGKSKEKKTAAELKYQD